MDGTADVENIVISDEIDTQFENVPLSDDAGAVEESTAPVPEESTAPVPEESTASVPEESTAPVPEESTAPVPEESGRITKDDIDVLRSDLSSLGNRFVESSSADESSIIVPDDYYLHTYEMLTQCSFLLSLVFGTLICLCFVRGLK